MKVALFLAMCCLLNYAAAQEDMDNLIDEIFLKPHSAVVVTNAPTIDDLINEIFARPQDKTADKSAKSEDEDISADDCECVPFHRCSNTDLNNVVDIRVNDSPCDYLSICCSPEDMLPDTRTTPSPPGKSTPTSVSRPTTISKPTPCGRRNPGGFGNRIGGRANNEAEFAEFPWMVALFRQEAHPQTGQAVFVFQCGGALIHPQVVLTSAHCVARNDRNFRVRVGEWDRLSTNEMFDHQDREVQTVITHPYYYSGGLFNDIAILILNAAVEIAAHVDVVCLPKQGMVVADNTRCFATGWGKNVSGTAGRYQSILKRIDLPVVPRATCQDLLRTEKKLRRGFQLHASFICAGGEPGKSTCKGDGGSPLVCPIPGQINKYFQAGIASWGVGCGEKQIPELYAFVPLYSDWIDQQLTNYNFNTSYYKY